MKYQTTCGPLKWTHISGKGSPKYGKSYTSENLEDFEFKATRVISEKEAKEVQKTINEFWKENKPAKVAKPSSTFLKPIMGDSDELDEFGAPIKKPTGEYAITASTNRVFKKKDDSYQDAKVVILRKNGSHISENHPLALGEVGVADGSEGVIHGNLAITEYEGKAYVKFYLKGVQFLKFVPYENTGIEAEEIGDSEDEDDGFDGDGLSAAPINEPTENKPEI